MKFHKHLFHRPNKYFSKMSETWLVILFAILWFLFILGCANGCWKIMTGEWLCGTCGTTGTRRGPSTWSSSPPSSPQPPLRLNQPEMQPPQPPMAGATMATQDQRRSNDGAGATQGQRLKRELPPPPAYESTLFPL